MYIGSNLTSSEDEMKKMYLLMALFVLVLVSAQADACFIITLEN